MPSLSEKSLSSVLVSSGSFSWPHFRHKFIEPFKSKTLVEQATFAIAFPQVYEWMIGADASVGLSTRVSVRSYSWHPPLSRHSIARSWTAIQITYLWTFWQISPGHTTKDRSEPPTEEIVSRCAEDDNFCTKLNKALPFRTKGKRNIDQGVRGSNK